MASAVIMAAIMVSIYTMLVSVPKWCNNWAVRTHAMLTHGQHEEASGGWGTSRLLPDIVHACMLTCGTHQPRMRTTRIRHLHTQHGMGNTTALTIPRSVVGRIIGRGGETIKMLQRKYQVSIQIDQSCDPMNVTVTGPKPGADLCRQEVMALASDMPGPGFGGAPHTPYTGIVDTRLHGTLLPVMVVGGHMHMHAHQFLQPLPDCSVVHPLG